MTAHSLLLISVVRPTLEYGSEVWEGNKAQAAALESVMIGGAKRTLGCSSRTGNEAVRGDMGLDSLQGRRDKAKLKWWYKVATMPEHRYSRKLFVQEWNVKPRRGRQRKYWCKVVDNLFSSLGLDKECLLCDAECESVSHVLPAYASIKSAFMLELRRELGDIGLSTFRVRIVLRSHLMS